jgi:GntR family transcriptional regulator/GntR family frlABCD operon transcriptional regulator
MEKKETKIPQYRMLYELLRKQIVDGFYKEGDILPSENELCAVHNLTRPTVRHALDALVNEGFIKKHQGKGSIVHKLPKGVGILSIAGTTSALGSKNLKTKVIKKAEVIPWPEDFMFRPTRLEIESGCIYLERIRYFNNQPIFYDINYIPNLNLPRFTSRNLDEKSLFDVLRSQYQVEIKGGEQKLRAIPASDTIAKNLIVERGNPVLHLERKFDTNRHEFHIYSSIFCNTNHQAIYGIF